jgi:hypothetical protein
MLPITIVAKVKMVPVVPRATIVVRERTVVDNLELSESRAVAVAVAVAVALRLIPGGVAYGMGIPRFSMAGMFIRVSDQKARTEGRKQVGSGGREGTALAAS